MNDVERGGAVGNSTLRLAQYLGHIPEDIYNQQELLREWWITLGDVAKKRMFADIYCFMQMNERRPWWKKFLVSYKLPPIPREVLDDDQLLNEWWQRQDERPWWKKQLGLFP